MAYRDYNGKITIDELAAKRDIQKINEAVKRLEKARDNLNQLISQGSAMKGSSGEALVSKGVELKRRVEKLISNLQQEVAFINGTIEKYKRLDREVKEAIQRQ